MKIAIEVHAEMIRLRTALPGHYFTITQSFGYTQRDEEHGEISLIVLAKGSGARAINISGSNLTELVREAIAHFTPQEPALPLVAAESAEVAS